LSEKIYYFYKIYKKKMYRKTSGENIPIFDVEKCHFFLDIGTLLHI